jgi:putative two-component system response regulator
LLAEEVRKATAQILEREQETVFCLARAAEYRDPETGVHIVRMAHYSKHIGRMLGLSVEQQDLLLETAPMHDIGKVGTPDLILLKPGKLTDAEFSIMKQHAVIGYEILNASTSPLLKVAAEIALNHHEKFDGSGYPNGAKGDAIPQFGRIVAVADVFDALTSERPYKKAWSIEQATQMLRDGAGKHFDPDCVEAFFADFDEILAIKARFADEEIEIRDRALD